MPTRRIIAARVVTLLSEPLLTNQAREMIEHDYTELIGADPVWVGAWVSGLLSGTMTSLPFADPWRHLAADLDGVRIGDPNTSKPLTSVGDPRTVWSPEGWFGTARDHDDLVLADFPGDQLSDIGLAAGHTNLPDDAGVLLAAAGRGWRDTLAALWMVGVATWDGRGHGAARTPGTNVVQIKPSGGSVDQAVAATAQAGLTAVRSAAFRRRTYLGGYDQTFSIHAFGGFGWCDQVAEQLTPDQMMQACASGQWDVLLEPVKALDGWSWPSTERIDEDAYSEFHLDS